MKGSKNSSFQFFQWSSNGAVTNAKKEFHFSLSCEISNLKLVNVAIQCLSVKSMYWNLSSQWWQCFHNVSVTSIFIETSSLSILRNHDNCLWIYTWKFIMFPMAKKHNSLSSALHCNSTKILCCIICFATSDSQLRHHFLS